MKKIAWVVFICLLAFGIYYAYKHRNEIMYKFSGDKIELSKDNCQLEVANLKSKLDDEIAYSNGLHNKILDKNDTISILKDEIARLKDKYEQSAQFKVIRTVKNPLSTTHNTNNKPTNKNEKILPIARGRAAVELKEFFTDRYDHR